MSNGLEKRTLLEERSMVKKPFIIVMGDTGEFRTRLSQEKPSKIINGARSQGWTLERTKSAIYWMLSDEVKNLTKQFMNFAHPHVYLIVNYKI